ncbi:hypothetical protein BASA81_002396 [Batrachochytrium salamandrivorans]|nr:hypothetical protein BASA81_002396 [Batrachochytrium salamandrivorans]
MVLKFETLDGTVIYMGVDKYENEKLIKWGLPCDIWFHVDDLSSAHVYLRLARGPNLRKFKETGRLDHLPVALADCIQLVKANSIEGSKQSKVAIVYTPWENLKKSGDMAVGQVGFHDLKKVITVPHVERDREALSRLNKTRVMEDKHENDLQAERHAYDREIILLKRERARIEAKERLQQREAFDKEKYDKSYDRIFEHMTEETVKPKIKATEDAKAAVEFEEDFM